VTSRPDRRSAPSECIARGRGRSTAMHATIRRYEGADAARTNEVTASVNEKLVLELRKLTALA